MDDPIIAEYVNRVGQNLVRNSDAKVPFTIKVTDSEEVNAFALPGGFFFVNSGLILKADNEAELAGVMAHELAHVRNRDTLVMTLTATLAGAISMLANFGLFFGGGRGRNNPLGAIGVILVMVLAPQQKQSLLMVQSHKSI